MNRNNLIRILLAALAVLTVCGCKLAGFYGNDMENVYAADEKKFFTVTYDSIFHDHGYEDSDGNIAYCANQNLSGPGTDGTKYHKISTKHSYDYLMYHGYPSTNVINGVKWSDNKARDITQYATWLLELGSSFNKEGESEEWNKAADKLYKKAAAYKGGGPEDGASTLWASDDSGKQKIILPNPKGNIKLKKVSANPKISGGNNCYSLKDALYGVYSDNNCTKKTGELRTDEEGESNTLNISPGKYWVKEIKAPKGFSLDPQAHSVTVRAGETAIVSVKDMPGYDSLSLQIEKIDNDAGGGVCQGAAALAGAQFTVKYYDGFYSSGNLPPKAKCSWVIEVRENRSDDGTVRYMTSLADEYKVSGNELFYDGNKSVLPYGTVSIEETKAPAGYRLENSYLQPSKGGDKVEGMYVAQIKDQNGGVHLTGGNAYTVSDRVIRGGVKVQKRDQQSGDAWPEGGAVLEGAQFEIINISKNAVIVDGRTFKSGEVVKTITSNEQGIAQTAPDSLPYGDYRLCESSAPKGYLKHGTIERTFSIRKEGEIVSLAGKDNSVLDQVKRGDLQFTKIEAGTHKRMAGIPFRITSVTTKESHIAVTDENGYFSTESSVNPHSSNTNVNDSHTEDEQFDLFAGIWFGLNEAGENVAVDDGLGALPFDTYLIEELPCKANEKHELVPAFEIKIYADKRVVQLGTVTNEAPEIPEEIQIHTVATNKDDGSKTVQADGQVTIVDLVDIKGLEVGKDYRLFGWEMMKNENTELKVDGKRVENTVEFAADAKDKQVEIEFTFDASSLGGSDLVIYEELYDITEPENPELVAEHKDIRNEDQTVFVGEQEIQIHTAAVNKADGSKKVKADKKVTIIDTVTVKGLKTGQKYRLSGWQMIKEKNTELMVDGKRVKSDLFFVADVPDKELKLEFTFDASSLGGLNLVTFEELYETRETGEPEKVAIHKDIEDGGQTVSVEKRPEKKIPGTTPSRLRRAAEAVKTGDTQNILLWTSLLAFAFTAGIFAYRKRKD